MVTTFCQAKEQKISEKFTLQHHIQEQVQTHLSFNDYTPSIMTKDQILLKMSLYLMMFYCVPYSSSLRT